MAPLSILEKQVVIKEWHNMVEAINHYKDFLFVNTDWYQCKRIDNEETTMNLFIERKDQLKKESNILNGKNHVNVCDNLKTLADIDSILGQYHSPEAPYFYHPMWYEIKPSINQWLLSREMIASTLAPDKAKAFRKLDRELIDCLYYHIELLDYWELRPCFPDERDMSRL